MIIIRVKLNEQKGIYRDIVVDTNTSLYDLAEMVVKSFGFDFDHSFGFYSSPSIYSKGRDTVHYELFYDMGEEVDELAESVEQTPVQELFKLPKNKWWMLFDYGDDWVFELVYQQDSLKLFADKPSGSVVAVKGEAPEQYPEWGEGEDDMNMVTLVKGNIPSDQEIEQYAKDFMDTLEGKSAKTISSYEQGFDPILTYFTQYCREDGVSARLDEIEPKHIDYLLQHFVILKFMASNSLKRHTAKAAKAFFGYLADREAYDAPKAKKIAEIALHYAREYPRIANLEDALWDEIEGETDGLMQLPENEREAEIKRLRKAARDSELMEVGYTKVLRLEGDTIYAMPTYDDIEEVGPVRLGAKSLPLVRVGDIINMITLCRLKDDTAWQISELGYVYPRPFESASETSRK